MINSDLRHIKGQFVITMGPTNCILLYLARCIVCAKARGRLVKTISPNTEKVWLAMAIQTFPIKCRRATRLPLSSIDIALCHAVSAVNIRKVGEKELDSSTSAW